MVTLKSGKDYIDELKIAWGPRLKHPLFLSHWLRDGAFWLNPWWGDLLEWKVIEIVSLLVLWTLELGATSKIRCPEDFGLIGNQLGWPVQRTKPDSDSIWAQLDIAPVNLFENGKYGAGPSYYICRNIYIGPSALTVIRSNTIFSSLARFWLRPRCWIPFLGAVHFWCVETVPGELWYYFFTVL